MCHTHAYTHAYTYTQIQKYAHTYIHTHAGTLYTHQKLPYCISKLLHGGVESESAIIAHPIEDFFARKHAVQHFAHRLEVDVVSLDVVVDVVLCVCVCVCVCHSQ